MKKFLLSLIVLVFITGIASSQEWVLLNTGNSDIPSNKIISLGITDNDVIYIGTPGGLVDPSHVYEYTDSWHEMDWFSEFRNMKSSPLGHLAIATGKGVFHYDGTTHTLFNEDNSNLTASNISDIDIGSDGTEYIGMTASGLLFTGGFGIYDGSFWAVYNSGNSPLPVDNVISVFAGQSGVVWIGTQNSGLMKKDGSDWELFNTENSNIPGDTPIHFAQSASGMLWISFSNGSIANFNGSDWTYIRTENEPGNLPESNVTDMLFDAGNNLWMSFESDGFAKYDGVDWTFFTSLLSPLPSDNVTGLELSSDGEIWIGTRLNGLVVYDPDFGMAIDDFLSPENIVMYPNPVDVNLVVKFKELTGKADLYIYNLMGQLVIQEQMNEHLLQINCSELQSGYYTLQLKTEEGSKSVAKAFIKR